VAIDSRAANWRKQVNDLTGGKGLDLVYDPVGGSYTEMAFRALGWDGRHLMIGFAAGEIPRLPCNLPLIKGAHLIGCNLLQARKFDSVAYDALAAEVVGLLSERKLGVPPVARRYPLSEISQAYQEVAAGEVAGRIVVKPWE
jgi:NADPH2:quinone reductase